MKQYYCPHCGDKKHHKIDAVTETNGFGWTSIIFCCNSCDMIFEVWEWPEQVKITDITYNFDVYDSGSYLLVRHKGWRTVEDDENGKL